MARNFTTRPLTVTGILRTTGEAVPGLIIDSGQQVRDFLLPRARVTDGTVTATGWSDLVCSECGDSAKWCPDLSAELPAQVGA